MDISQRIFIYYTKGEEIKMNNKDKTIWNKWDEIEYGLYTIASEATTLLRRLNELRTEMESEK